MPGHLVDLTVEVNTAPCGTMRRHKVAATETPNIAYTRITLNHIYSCYSRYSLILMNSSHNPADCREGSGSAVGGYSDGWRMQNE